MTIQHKEMRNAMIGALLLMLLILCGCDRPQTKYQKCVFEKQQTSCVCAAFHLPYLIASLICEQPCEVPPVPVKEK